MGKSSTLPPPILSRTPSTYISLIINNDVPNSTINTCYQLGIIHKWTLILQAEFSSPEKILLSLLLETNAKSWYAQTTFSSILTYVDPFLSLNSYIYALVLSCTNLALNCISLCPFWHSLTPYTTIFLFPATLMPISRLHHI